jgi:hypothetical protein
VLWEFGKYVARRRMETGSAMSAPGRAELADSPSAG